MTTEQSTSRPLTLEDLNAFTGDLVRYRHAINRSVIYTPGIQYLAETGGAYWLVDDIAIMLGSQAFQRLMARTSELTLHFWKLTVNDDSSALLTATLDSAVPPFIRRRMLFTDFPLKEVNIWAAYDGRYWTLYLPSEH